jgi:hypothetical protein
MGLNGIDTLGLLKSGAGVSPAASSTPQVDDFPPPPVIPTCSSPSAHNHLVFEHISSGIRMHDDPKNMI